MHGPGQCRCTTFWTQDGHYKWLVMQMSLTNTPSSFQRVMAMVFDGLPFVEVYIDYILIHSPDQASHLVHVLAVLAWLCEYRFYLKLHKY